MAITACSIERKKKEGYVASLKSSNELGEGGKFVRQRNRFTTPFGDDLDELPVEANRYRILWSPVCPWAHRTIIVRRLLGLEDVISVGTLDPIRPDTPTSDWAFTLDKDNVDPVLNIHYLSEIYLSTDPSYKGRPTVPCVVDLKTRKVVNNDYFNLTRYWETKWIKFHKEGAPDLYPVELRDEIDKFNDELFDKVNNGVYKAGFAQSQEAYEDAVKNVFKKFDELEERLNHSRYLFGDRITEADVRLYVTLARFDIAYYNAFKVNLKTLKEYKNLWAYARDLYQTRGFGDTTNFDAIKKHYHLCCVENPYKILPLGPDLSDWNSPHYRDTREYK